MGETKKYGLIIPTPNIHGIEEASVLRGDKGPVVVETPDGGEDSQMCAYSFLMNYWGGNGFNEYSMEYNRNPNNKHLVSAPHHVNGVRIVDLTDILENECEVLKKVEAQPAGTF